jgi:uncharacterized protein YuzE
MLRTEYDQEADALYLTITDEPVARTEEVDPGTLVPLARHEVHGQVKLPL